MYAVVQCRNSVCSSLTAVFMNTDLCIAAALDAVKESVDVPWLVPSKSPAAPSPPPKSSSASLLEHSSLVQPTRTVAARHFEKALHEITPSASESLGTLSSLRRWNEEFGEGASKKGRKRRGWGDKFGFGLPHVSNVEAPSPVLTPIISPTNPTTP